MSEVQGRSFREKNIRFLIKKIRIVKQISLYFIEKE